MHPRRMPPEADAPEADHPRRMQMKIGQGTSNSAVMPILDHLEELRRRLLWIPGA
ncbi:MAG: hypothetical protein NVSMB53_18530 [Gemmatimonadaceae bacterium]